MNIHDYTTSQAGRPATAFQLGGSDFTVTANRELTDREISNVHRLALHLAAVHGWRDGLAQAVELVASGYETWFFQRV